MTYLLKYQNVSAFTNTKSDHILPIRFNNVTRWDAVLRHAQASAEREPILGIWGLYPSGVQWQLAPGGVSAEAKPPEADELSAN